MERFFKWTLLISIYPNSYTLHLGQLIPSEID